MAVRLNIGLVDAAMKADMPMDDFQYYCVHAASTQHYVQIASGACDPYPIGVYQGNAASTRGDPVDICLFGPCIAKVATCALDATESCPIRVGHPLVCSPSGILVTAGSTDTMNAYALEPITTASTRANISIFWLGGFGTSPVASS